MYNERAIETQSAHNISFNHVVYSGAGKTLQWRINGVWVNRHFTVIIDVSIFEGCPHARICKAVPFQGNITYTFEVAFEEQQDLLSQDHARNRDFTV